MTQKAAGLYDDDADELEIARSKRYSFGKKLAETKTEIDQNEQSMCSSPESLVYQETEGDWLRVDYFDPLDAQKQESMENNFNDLTLPLTLHMQESQDSMLQQFNLSYASRKASDAEFEAPDLEIQTFSVEIPKTQVKELEQPKGVDNVIIAGVREVAQTFVPEIQPATPAFVVDNENSLSSLVSKASTANKYRH